MTICREWLLVKTQGDMATAEPLKCRSWSCELCAPDRRKRLIAQAIAGNPNTFITLTVNPKHGTSPSHRARLLVLAWRAIRRLASSKVAQIDPLQLEQWRADPRWRSIPKRPRDILGGEHPDNGTLPFLAVFERTKRGEPHLHILCRAEWVPQQWLSRCCASFLGAPIVWIERITNPAKMAAYVAKYCAKDPARFDTVKRYWTSQDYEIELYDDDDDIEEIPITSEVFKGGLHEWITERTSEGWWAWTTPEGGTAWNVKQAKPEKRFLHLGRAPPASPSSP